MQNIYINLNHHLNHKIKHFTNSLFINRYVFCDWSILHTFQYAVICIHFMNLKVLLLALSIIAETNNHSILIKWKYNTIPRSFSYLKRKRFLWLLFNTIFFKHKIANIYTASTLIWKSGYNNNNNNTILVVHRNFHGFIQHLYIHNKYE